MKKPVIAVVAVVAVAAVAGGGYGWARHQGQVALEQATQGIRAGLAPNGSFTYASADVHPFQHAADLSTVALRATDGTLLTADHVTIVSDGDGRISNLHASGLRIKGTAQDGSATAATFDGKDISFQPPVAGGPIKIDPAVMTFAGITLRDLAFTGPASSGKLASLEIDDYGAGRPSSFVMEGFSTPVAALEHIDHAGFDSFRTFGIDFASAIDAVEHNTKMPQLSSGEVRVELDGLYGAEGADKHFVIRKSVMSGKQGADGTSSVAKLELAGVYIEPMASARRVEFAELGLHKLTGSFSATASYQLAGGKFEMSPLLEVDGFGMLSFGLKLAHLDASGLVGAKPDPAALLALARNTQVVSGYVSLVDAGLVDWALTTASRKLGMSKDQLRAQAIDQARQNTNFDALPDGELMRAAVIAFITHGGKIGIAMHPPAPINLLDVIQAGQNDPMNLVNQVGLSVTGS